MHRRTVLNKNDDKAVVCIETGLIYPQIKIAAKKIGSHPPNISRAIKNGSTAKGFHWKYAKEEM